MPRHRAQPTVPEPWSPERRKVPRDWRSMDEARLEWEARCALTGPDGLTPEESQALWWRKLAWGVLDAVAAGDFDRCARELGLAGWEPRRPIR